MKTSHYHWALSGVLLLLLTWQIRYLLSAPAAPAYQSPASLSPFDVPWYAQTDVVIALLAASLFVVMLFVRRPSHA